MTHDPTAFVDFMLESSSLRHMEHGREGYIMYEKTPWPSGHEGRVFAFRPHLARQRPDVHGTLGPQQIEALRGAFVAHLDVVWNSFFERLTLESLNRYKQVISELDTLKAEQRRMREQLSALQDLLGRTPHPSVAEVVHQTQGDPAFIGREQLLSRIAAKRTEHLCSRTPESIAQDAKEFVRSEIENAPNPNDDL